jgi:hypothetical protein
MLGLDENKGRSAIRSSAGSKRRCLLSIGVDIDDNATLVRPGLNARFDFHKFYFSYSELPLE